MRTLVRRMWKAAPVATVVLVVALVAGGFFAFRTTAHWIYWNDPAHRDQTIAGWMTPGYVGKSWDIPREVLTEALGVQPGPGRRRNLNQIAQEQGRSLDALIAKIEAAMAEFRAGQLAPESAPPEPRP